MPPSPGDGGGGGGDGAPAAQTADPPSTASLPATVAALHAALASAGGGNAQPQQEQPSPAGTPAWLDAAARAVTAGPAAAAALLATSAPAWSGPDPASRRAACRLARTAMQPAGNGDNALAAAAACLAARCALSLLVGGGSGEATATSPADAVLADAAAALDSPAGRAWLAGLDAPARAEAAAAASAAAVAVAHPPDSLFADAGGDPLPGPPADGGGADAWARRATACVRLAACLAGGAFRPGDAQAAASARAPKTPPPAPRPRLESGAGLWSIGDGTGGAAAAAAGLPTTSAPKGLVIEVIGGDDDGPVEEEEGGGKEDAAAVAAAAAAAASVAAADAAVDALLAAALYASSDDDALPLAGAWVLPPATVSSALTTLAAGLGVAAGDRPALVAALLRPALRPLRGTLVQAHWTGLDAVKMTPYEGPGPFTRCLGGRQLAVLARWASAESLAGAWRSGALVPVVLAAADDPAPAVQAAGLAALLRVATAVPPSTLGGDRTLLLGAARKAVVGCDGRAWRAASAAAVAVVRALDAAAGGQGGEPAPPPPPPSSSATQKAVIGRPTTAFTPPPPAACLALLPDFLAEGERHAHERTRSREWLAAAGPLLAGCGAGSLALGARLFPLILRWLAAPDETVRTSAAAALAVLLRASWPRVPAHAAHLWAHLSSARAGKPGFEPSEAEVGALEECAAIVWAAGGDEFRKEAVQAGGGDGSGGRALLAAIGVDKE